MLSRARPDKDTKSTAGDAVRYERCAHAPGLHAWVYSYANRAPLGRAWVGCGLELGVQLAGRWHFASRFTGAREHGPSTICRASMGEAYQLAYQTPAGAGPGLQVGFVLFDDELEALAPGESLRLVGDAGMVDRELSEFARWYYDARRVGRVDADAVRRAVGRYVARHGERVPASPLARAKRELEQHFDCDLAMHHVCAAAGLHPETFARRFAAEYGITPAAYRVRLRVNHAARLCWARPELPIAEVGRLCGFRNRAYFHRAFYAAFGATPAQVRARFLGPGAAGELASA